MCYWRFQLHTFISRSLPSKQSAYRPFRSSDLLSYLSKVVSSMLWIVVSSLVSFDPYQAFNTVTLTTFLPILCYPFFLKEAALEWFLSTCSQSFSYAGKQTTTFPIDCNSCNSLSSVCLNSLLIPEKSAQIIDNHNIKCWLCASDAQLYAGCKPLCAND